jgi:hypothetical protein
MRGIALICLCVALWPASAEAQEPPEQRELGKAFALCHGGFLIPEPVEACDAISARWASIGTTRSWEQRRKDAEFARHVADEVAK